MAINPEEGGLEEEGYIDNNIIISYYTIRKIIPPQLNKTSARCKVMCGCECCITDKIMHHYLLIWCDCHLKQLKDQIQNAQNRRSSVISSQNLETYKNDVKPHGCFIHNTATDMSISKICPCTSTKHGLPHCKVVLCCCDK